MPKSTKLDVASALPGPRQLDAEELLAGMEEARQRIATWLGVDVDDVYMQVTIHNDQVRSRLAMPEDTTESTHERARQHWVYRAQHRMRLNVCERYEPAEKAEVSR